jgi:hypothetical protein
MTMRKATVGATVTLAAIAGVWNLTAVSVLGQATPSTAPALVVTAFGGEAPKTRYVAPRTPWGDPDLEGVWSTDDTSGIPMARPAQFGDRLYLNAEEFAARAQQIERGITQGDQEAVGPFRFDFARRAFHQTSLIVDPPDGRLPAFTPEGTQRPMPRGTYGDGPLDWTTDFSLYERCITRGILGSTLRVIYGNGAQISQGPGVVAITYEMIHDTRIIPTDGRPHPGPAIEQYLGDAKGRWDGDELVVETTNFTNRTAIGLNGNGNRTSTKLKLTERFKRVAKDIVQYQVTVDDPVTYERPWTMSMPLTPLDGGRILPYSCHEGNMALTQSLGGERAEDRALEEDRKKGIIRPRRPVQDGLGVGGAPVGAGGFGAGRGAPPPAPPAAPPPGR